MSILSGLKRKQSLHFEDWRATVLSVHRRLTSSDPSGRTSRLHRQAWHRPGFPVWVRGFVAEIPLRFLPTEAKNQPCSDDDLVRARASWAMGSAVDDYQVLPPFNVCVCVCIVRQPKPWCGLGAVFTPQPKDVFNSSTCRKPRMLSHKKCQFPFNPKPPNLGLKLKSLGRPEPLPRGAPC